MGFLIEMKRIVVRPDIGYQIYGEQRGRSAEYPATGYLFQPCHNAISFI